MRFLETICCDEGRPRHLEYHQQRMARTLDAFGIQTRYNLSHLIAPPDDTLLRCRVLYDAEGCHITYHAYIPRRFQWLRLVTDDTIVYDYKYTNRNALDTLYQQRGDADEIIIVKNGLLTDATIANIALYDGTAWYTPKAPLLHGSTRERLLHEGQLFEAEISLDTLHQYKRYALLNAMLGFVEVECGIMAPQ